MNYAFTSYMHSAVIQLLTLAEKINQFIHFLHIHVMQRCCYFINNCVKHKLGRLLMCDDVDLGGNMLLDLRIGLLKVLSFLNQSKQMFSASKCSHQFPGISQKMINERCTQNTPSAFPHMTVMEFVVLEVYLTTPVRLHSYIN